MAPEMIRRVGHVRVFAALGSMISAVLVLYAAAPDWIAWALMRVLIGFSFSGVYITAESWLNNASTNETRGQALSLYMIVQMVGIIAAQVLLNVGDPVGLHALRHPLGAGVAGLHADPAVGQPGAGLRDHQADELSPPLSRLAARLRRHLPARRGLFGASSAWPRSAAPQAG